MTLDLIPGLSLHAELGAEAMTARAFRAARARMRGRFVWGEADCAAAACAAFADLHGYDPMAELRGTYGDLQGALALAEAAGGYRALCADTLAAAGLVSSVSLQAGDLALAPWRLPFGHCLGLVLRPGLVAVKGGNGVGYWHGEPTEGWTCPS